MKFKWYYEFGFLIAVTFACCALIATKPRHILGRIIYTPSCALPILIRSPQISGAWETNYGSSDGMMVESITFNRDGTYIQKFENGFTNISTWDLIRHTPDSPKILLKGGIYYYEYTDDHIELGNSYKEKRLLPQPIDTLEYTADNDMIDENGVAVLYPHSGFIYVYPRICYGQLALQGMRSSPVVDYDALSTEGPIYQRAKTDP